MVGYGFGASFVALFMQLGGGIYTKAADVGADMVGKIEVSNPPIEQSCDRILAPHSYNHSLCCLDWYSGG
jgi:hypothetical protein